MKLNYKYKNKIWNSISIEMKLNSKYTGLNMKSRKKGVVRYADNPFWYQPNGEKGIDTTIKVGSKKIVVAAGANVDSKTGEITHHSGIHVTNTIDKEEFVKIYTKNIKLIFELKPSTQKVLQYILSQIQSNKDADGIYISWFGTENYLSEANIKISRSAFHNALKELLEKQFLAESAEPNMFWFNPHLFFNGNRMIFVNEYKMKQSQEDEKRNEWGFLPKPEQTEIKEEF
jgi:hypothetical protein